MPSSYQILLDGQPADADFYTSITSLEVEENMDLPGAFQLNLPVNRSDSGDLTYVADSRFKPLANIAVVATPAAGAATDLASAATSALGALGIGGGGASAAQCIFDGYILSYQHGAMKPDPRLYQVVETRTGCRSDELFYIDDRPENIQTAADRGWQVILQETAEQTRKAIQATGLLA